MTKLFYFLPFIFELSLTFSNAEPIKGNNIVTVQEGEFPFTASIIERSNILNVEQNLICTGVLISEVHVLTAAHCLENHTFTEIQVGLGSMDLRECRKYNPSKWITYDEWAALIGIRPEFEVNDIAVIKLSEKVNEGIATPIKISKKQRIELFHKNVTVAGWGLTNLRSDRPSRYLQKTHLVVMSDDHCADSVYIHSNEIVEVATNFFCSRADPYALIDCGDSGGPVLNDKKLVGINIGNCPHYNSSCSQEHNNEYRVNVHSSVHFFRRFITNVMNHY